MTEPVVRVLVADDDHMARSKLEDLLTSRPEDGIEVVGHAVNVTEAIEKCGELHPDVVLLDLCMPQAPGETPLAERGIGAIEELRRRDPEVRVLVVSVVGESPYLRKAIEIGTAGYLLKDDADAIPDAIKVVARGGFFISTGLRDQIGCLLESGRAQVQAEYHLTDAEIRVWIEISKEDESLRKPNTRIAERLHVAPATVRNIVNSLMAKTGCPGNRAALRRLGRAKGLGLM